MRMASTRRKPAAARPSRKKATNIMLPAELTRRAKSLGINLSSVSQLAIERAVRLAETKRWQAENEEAFDYADEHARKHGLFADEWRRF
jgi:antitoxin CcdA